MASATVELPTMIANVLGGVRRLEVNGTTLQEVLQDAFEKEPRLRVHVVDEHGEFRPHVLCFINEDNTRWHERRDLPIRDGDKITILQAVSGG